MTYVPIACHFKETEADKAIHFDYFYGCFVATKVVPRNDGVMLTWLAI
jgi:hypothetical protein